MYIGEVLLNLQKVFLLYKTVSVHEEWIERISEVDGVIGHCEEPINAVLLTNITCVYLCYWQDYGSSALPLTPVCKSCVLRLHGGMVRAMSLFPFELKLTSYLLTELS